MTSGLFVFNFEHILHIALVFTLLNLKKVNLDWVYSLIFCLRFHTKLMILALRTIEADISFLKVFKDILQEIVVFKTAAKNQLRVSVMVI